MEKYLVLDIGGTYIKYAIMDRDGNFLTQGKVPAVTTTQRAWMVMPQMVRTPHT